VESIQAAREIHAAKRHKLLSFYWMRHYHTEADDVNMFSPSLIVTRLYQTLYMEDNNLFRKYILDEVIIYLFIYLF
jgi:hypothetical protein